MNGLKSSRPIRPHERRVAARLLDGNGLALGTPLAALLAADASTPARIADLPIDAGVANGNGNTGNFTGNGNAGSFSGNFNGSSFNGNANCGDGHGNGYASPATAMVRESRAIRTCADS
jgi:hypothetical protein